MTVQKKILIIKLSALGDVIFTIPLANLLKKNGCEVHWLVTEKGYNIIKDNPCVDKAIFLPLYTWRKGKFSLKELIKIIRDLRREKYDISFDCQKRSKSLLFNLLCGAKRRIISRKGATEGSLLGANEYVESVKNAPLHMVYRNLAYAAHIGFDTSEIHFTLPSVAHETKTKVDKLLANLDKSKPTIILAPETTWESKHWDINNWHAVVDGLKDRANLVITGSNPEFLKGGLNLAGQTTIEDLIEIFSRADIVISPDSGSAHLAWATQKPAVIGIFTSTAPNIFGCFGDDKKYFALTGNIPCQPCFKRKCLHTHNECTKSPTPEKILKICYNYICHPELVSGSQAKRC